MIVPGPAMSYRSVGAESYESQNAVGSRARSQSPPNSEQRPGRRVRHPGLISGYSVIFIGSG